MNNYYQPDPLQPWQQPTSGQLPAVQINPVTPPPPHTHPPVARPALHPPLPKKSPIDQLASHSQRAIKKAVEEIYEALRPSCDCELCKGFLTSELSDLISEVLTDQTILTLSIQKVERSINRLADNIEQVMRYTKND